MRKGVEVGRVAPALLSDPEGRQLVDGGVVAIRGDRLQVIDPLLTDAVARVVLGLAEPDQALSTRT